VVESEKKKRDLKRKLRLLLLPKERVNYLEEKNLSQVPK